MAIEQFIGRKTLKAWKMKEGKRFAGSKVGRGGGVKPAKNVPAPAPAKSGRRGS